MKEELGEVSGLDTGGVTYEDRKWLDNAITAAGGVVTDGGFGCGGADLGYRLNGKSFSVNIKARTQTPTTDETPEAA